MFNSVENFLNQTNEKHSDEYNEFLNQNALFQKFIEDRTSLSGDELEDMKVDFEKIYPRKSFDDFLIENHLSTESICSAVPIFDTRNKKTYNPTILSPIRQKSNNNFDVEEFVRDMVDKNREYELNFEQDPPIEIDEEIINQNILAHQSLKSIGELALFLNKQRKEIPYTIMEVKAENYIH